MGTPSHSLNVWCFLRLWLQEEKARLHQQLSQATSGGSASEYKVNELQQGIDRLRYDRWNCKSDRHVSCQGNAML